jgi:hypothetical protein
MYTVKPHARMASRTSSLSSSLPKNILSGRSPSDSGHSATAHVIVARTRCRARLVVSRCAVLMGTPCPSVGDDRSTLARPRSADQDCFFSRAMGIALSILTPHGSRISSLLAVMQHARTTAADPPERLMPRGSRARGEG